MTNPIVEIQSADEDPFARPPHQLRTVAQPGCAPAGLASSVFDWRGSAPTEPESHVAKVAKKTALQKISPTNHTISEPTLTNDSLISDTRSKVDTAIGTDSGSPRFRILSALAAHGAMKLDRLSETSGVTGSSLSNAIYNAKKLATLRRLNDGVVEITDVGRRYLLCDHAGADAKFSKPRKESSSINTKTQLDQATSQHHTFVASLSSIGSFTLSKGNDMVSLDAEEYRSLQRYLNRVGGAAA